jgi:hypothetical protein
MSPNLPAVSEGNPLLYLVDELNFGWLGLGLKIYFTN